MSKIWNFFQRNKRNKKWFLIGLPVLAIVLFFVLGGGNDEEILYTVERGDVVQSVVLSGKVETSDRANLGFAESGRVARILVKNNQSVNKGQTLAQLEIGELVADLRIKEANLKTSDVELEEAKENLKKVTAQENAKVESAYRTLLTEDLELVPSSNGYQVDPPALSGIYDGPEGRYKIIIKKKDNSSDMTILTFGPEKTETVIKEEGPTLFGTKGLYISFPEDEISPYKKTIWYLDIPNKSSGSYLANYNAYNEAKKNRDLAVREADFNYQKVLSNSNKSDGGVSVAEAEVQRIQAEIRKNTIYAPFQGLVTNIEKEVGENASVGESVISILGEEKLEVVLQVSELDVSRLLPKLPIKITLDAFPGEEFEGVLESINSRETEVEGVPVYEAFVELSANPRIKAGMSANGEIILAEERDVLVVPTYVITEEEGKSWVEVITTKGKTKGKSEKREVTLGLKGTDSMVEILSGLSEGDQVVSNGHESEAK